MEEMRLRVLNCNPEHLKNSPGVIYIYCILYSVTEVDGSWQFEYRSGWQLESSQESCVRSKAIPTFAVYDHFTK